MGGLPGFAGGHFGGCEDDAVATVSFIYFFGQRRLPSFTVNLYSTEFSSDSSALRWKCTEFYWVFLVNDGGR